MARVESPIGTGCYAIRARLSDMRPAAPEVQAKSRRFMVKLRLGRPPDTCAPIHPRHPRQFAPLRGPEPAIRVEKNEFTACAIASLVRVRQASEVISLRSCLFDT